MVIIIWHYRVFIIRLPYRSAGQLLLVRWNVIFYCVYQLLIIRSRTVIILYRFNNNNYRRGLSFILAIVIAVVRAVHQCRRYNACGRCVVTNAIAIMFYLRPSRLRSTATAAASYCSGRPRPLDGVRVVDMTRVAAGPYCSMILADMGADVIKIERPGTGDDSRCFGPPFVDVVRGQSANSDDGRLSLYFMTLNRNKRSLCVDFRQPDGKRIVEQLASRSHVLIENYVPGTLDRLANLPGVTEPLCIYTFRNNNCHEREQEYKASGKRAFLRTVVGFICQHRLRIFSSSKLIVFIVIWNIRVFVYQIWLGKLFWHRVFSKIWYNRRQLKWHSF